jgi:hypothetical protein
MIFKHRSILAPELKTDIHAALTAAGREDLAARLTWCGMEDPEADEFRRKAHEFYMSSLDENDWDEDDDPLVSLGDDGAYVALWRWIPGEGQP